MQSQIEQATVGVPLLSGLTSPKIDRVIETSVKALFAGDAATDCDPNVRVHLIGPHSKTGKQLEIDEISSFFFSNNVKNISIKNWSAIPDLWPVCVIELAIK